MKILVLGASGATGRQAVQQLLLKSIPVRGVVRRGNTVLHDIANDPLLEVVTENIAEIDELGYERLLDGCDAAIVCLGHNITLKGIYGKPRLLVTDALKNLCGAIELSGKKGFRLILMSTVANRNKRMNERYACADRIVLSLLIPVLPPHRDNLKAAAYLNDVIGQDSPSIEWVAVRPDALIDANRVSGYEILPSPSQSPVFKPRKVSRINVAHFMAELLTDDALWNQWKGKMPVVCNGI